MDVKKKKRLLVESTALQDREKLYLNRPQQWENLHRNHVQRNSLHIETNIGKLRVFSSFLVSMIIKKSGCSRKRFYQKKCNGNAHFIILRFAVDQWATLKGILMQIRKSFCVPIYIKIISWKFHILNPKNCRVITTSSFRSVCLQTYRNNRTS